MNLENFVISVERDYPNGRFIHDIREKGCMFKFYVKSYLEKITLADLLAKNRVQEVAERQDQHAQQTIEIHNHADLMHTLQ